MKFLSVDSEVRVIVMKGEPLTDAQITQAFQVSEQTLWWRALMQLLEKYRHEHAASAADFVGKNNALAAARDCGAYEILSGLMVDLQERNKAKKE